MTPYRVVRAVCVGCAMFAACAFLIAMIFAGLFAIPLAMVVMIDYWFVSVPAFAVLAALGVRMLYLEGEL